MEINKERETIKDRYRKKIMSKWMEISNEWHVSPRSSLFLKKISPIVKLVSVSWRHFMCL